MTIHLDLSIEDVGTPPSAIVRLRIGKTTLDLHPNEIDDLVTTLDRLQMAARARDAARLGPSEYGRSI